MPQGFGLLDNSSDAWFTFGFDPPPGQEFQHNLRAIGRLKPGVSMRDARAAGCDILTIGQYLQPTKQHLPVVEFVHPDRFKAFEAAAYALGFASVFSGPLVRSSYHAEVVAGAVRMVG